MGKSGKSHLAHLIASLAATDVDDDVGVRILAQRLGNDLKPQFFSYIDCTGSFSMSIHRLAASEGPGDGRRSALYQSSHSETDSCL